MFAGVQIITCSELISESLNSREMVSHDPQKMDAAVCDIPLVGFWLVCEGHALLSSKHGFCFCAFIKFLIKY